MSVFAATLGPTEIWMIVAVVVLFVASIFLSMAETSLLRLSTARARAIAAEGGFGTRRLVALVEHPERFLNVVLLVVLVCQLVQATLIGIVSERLFGGWGVLIATVVNVIVVFVVAEAIPKTWAIEHTVRAARLCSGAVWRLSRLWPLPWIARGLIGLTNVIIPGKGLAQGPFVSEEEFLAYAEEAVTAEILEEGEREFIEQVIEFGDTICREIMVPRPDLLALSDSTTVAETLDKALTAGRSRVPVFGTGIDDVTGIAFVKDLARASRAGRDDDPVRKFARRPFFVPETKRIAELLGEMRTRRSHIAVVIDEYGGTAGIVTMEDVIEELIGEISDEYDTVDSQVQRLPGGVLVLQARLAIDEASDALGVELPEGDWDTLGGLMFHLLGHVPFEGESIVHDGLRLRAEQVKGRRIGAVRVERVGEHA